MISCTLKLDLRPAQARYFERWLWHLTAVHNWTVRKIELDARHGIYHSLYDLQGMIAGHSERLGIPSKVIKATIADAHRTWDRCFSGTAGKPRLKGRRNRLSSLLFTDRSRLQVSGRTLKLNGSHGVKFYPQDVPKGALKQARLIRRASGWYVALMIDAEPKPIVSGAGEIGIDPGFSALLTLSTGEKIEHPRELERWAQRLAQAQRGRRHKLTARLHERVRCQRLNRNHHLSRQLVEANRVIAFSADRHHQIARLFGKNVTSSAHSQLRQMLTYKSRLGGGQYVEVASRNSTRICSACGAKTGPTGWAGLKVRQWVCPACGAEHDRDVNAAVNTLKAGLGISHERRRETASGIAS